MGRRGTKACDNASKARMETIPDKDYILLPLSIQDPPFSSSLKDSPDAGFKPLGEEEKKDVKDPGNEYSEVLSTEEPRVNQEKDSSVNNTNTINTVSPTVNTASIEDNAVDENIVYGCDDDPNMPELEEIVYSDDDEDFKLQHVWTLVDLPNGKRAIGTKWVYRNKKDERGIVIKNKARLVAQGYTQEEGIDYDEMMTRVLFCMERLKRKSMFVNHQGFEDPDFPDRVYKVEKALRYLIPVESIHNPMLTLNVAFCLLEDLTAFCLKISLRFASRPHCVLLQDLIAFCFKLSLRFASISLRFAQDLHCVLLEDHIAF
ncbi:ribonuclease H-like domain-containing protein [Tanacetum coccineum]